MSYEQSASVYDAIYENAKKNYRAESLALHALIGANCASGGKRLLDVACGTGLHDQYLVGHYDVEGLDLSEAQIAIARARLPKMTFYLDDMVNFSLGTRYDVITCLFSAIGYIRPTELDATIATFEQHLLPGGVIIIEPWLMPHMLRLGNVGVDVVEEADRKIARFCNISLDGNVTTLTMHHMVATSEGTDYFVEEHTTTMFTEIEFHQAFAAHGLMSSYYQPGISANGRGVLIGRKALS